MPTNLLAQNSMLVAEPIMSMGSTPLVDGLNRTSQTSGHRFAFDDPVPVSRTAPVVRKTEQVEGLRLAMRLIAPLPRSILGRLTLALSGLR